MVITDLPEKLPGLDACAACIAAKAVHFPHKERYSCAGGYLGRFHIDIARPMQVKSAGGEYIVMDDYTHGVQVTTTAQVGSARSLRGIQGHSRERMPEKDARNHDGQDARTVYGRDEGYLRVERH